MWGILLFTTPNHRSYYMGIVEYCLHPAAFLAIQPKLSLVQLPSANMFVTSREIKMHSNALNQLCSTICSKYHYRTLKSRQITRLVLTGALLAVQHEAHNPQESPCILGIVPRMSRAG